MSQYHPVDSDALVRGFTPAC